MAQRVALESSRREAVQADKLGRTDPKTYIQVSVHLRPSQTLPRPETQGIRLPKDRKHLTREEFTKAYGAHDHDIAAVERFAHQNGLDVVRADRAQKTVVLGGAVAALETAFGTELYDHKAGDQTFRARTGTLSLPSELNGIVVAVLGLDSRPVARPHSRTPARKHLTGRPLFPTQVASLYKALTGADGSGQCIALIELGGGYATADLDTYFKQDLGFSSAPVTTAISVDGGRNQPGVDQGADGEVALDIEVAGAVAPGAQLAVYFAPNTDAGFVDAINSAVHDAQHKPSIVSISWGGPEESWTDQARSVMEQAFQAAAALGVTVFVASGDNGSTDGVPGGKQHVDYPASSPSVTGCGGTTLVASPDGSTIQGEEVWNELKRNEGATGGGISNVFPLPSYQSDAVKIVQPDTNFRGRGVPDVAGNADPTTGYIVRFGGNQMPIGGTSAVAPLYAGLLARINQFNGSAAGFINPLLYAVANKPAPDGRTEFNDITRGDNPKYKAVAGWDPCTGWGSPNGLFNLVQ
jgi:kumamolisin